ncbi:vitellogenin receptor-like isoform X2 [Varroa jacobsoni]|nr:vitellogenin receptor-like isoform X2 [Varroa jacobsoni]XP_022700079.1 vitellogenin receptor-like isoform X2 [Varroa jacobsoni]
MYLVVANGSKIVVCRTDRPYCTDIFNGRDGAHSIRLDTVRGDLYWGERHGRVYKGRMDGKLSQIFLFGDPSKTAEIGIDLATERFYWQGSQSNIVEFIYLNNVTQSEIVIPAIRTPSALAISQDMLYWSEVSENKSTLSICTSQRCTKQTVLGQTETANYFKLKLSSMSMQPTRPNPCRKRPCSHICAISGPADNDFSCLCPRHFSLISKTLCEVTVSSFFVVVEEELFKAPVDAALNNDLSVQDEVMRVPRMTEIVVDDAESVLYGVTYGQVPKLIKININNGLVTEFWAGASEHIKSLVFDPLHRLLYWLDSQHKTVVLFNVDRKEMTRIQLHSSRSETIAEDLAVDFRRGIFYILFELNGVHQDRVIQQYGLDGRLESELPKMSYKPERIAIDQSTGSLVMSAAVSSEDSVHRNIFVFDVQTGASSVLAENTLFVTKLHAWFSRTFWITPYQRGFFGIAEPKGNISHIVREYWRSPTAAIAISGLHVNPIERAMCSVENGGCSNTCVNSIAKGRACICPDGMMLEDGTLCVTHNKTLECTHDEFACTNDFQCIRWQYKCNGVNDCDDGSDEKPSICDEVGKCSPDTHRCAKSLECIPVRLFCDGVAHCQDESDEVNCTTVLLGTNEFRLSGVFTVKWNSERLIAVGILAAAVAFAMIVSYAKCQQRKYRSVDTRHIELKQLPVTLSKMQPIHG